MGTLRAVIFDCDGTLVDSEELGLSVLAQVAAEAGFAPDRVSELSSMRGEAMVTCLAFVAKNVDHPLPTDFESVVRQRMAVAFREHLQAMPGARSVVAGLQVPICVATNGPRSRAELTLGLTGLLPFFQGRIYSAVEVGAFKPSPDLFLFAAASMKVSPRECAVVEDSLPGVRAGLAAGMQVYTVRGDHALPSEISGRVTVLNRLEDLLHTFERQNISECVDCGTVRERRQRG